MEAGARVPVGDGELLRLDPFALPARFAAVDATADGRRREVEIDRTRVVLRRRVAGIPMHLSLPLSSYLGVALRIEPGEAPERGRLALVLAHRDPALTVVLARATDGDTVVSDWRAWSRTLGRPLLVPDGQGGWRTPVPQIGAVVADRPLPRRRRRSAHARRRPSALMRRKPGRLPAKPAVHREREIIARH